MLKKICWRISFFDFYLFPKDSITGNGKRSNNNSWQSHLGFRITFLSDFYGNSNPSSSLLLFLPVDRYLSLFVSILVLFFSDFFITVVLGEWAFPYFPSPLLTLFRYGVKDNKEREEGGLCIQMAQLFLCNPPCTTLAFRSRTQHSKALRQSISEDGMKKRILFFSKSSLFFTFPCIECSKFE